MAKNPYIFDSSQEWQQKHQELQDAGLAAKPYTAPVQEWPEYKAPNPPASTSQSQTYSASSNSYDYSPRTYTHSGSFSGSPPRGFVEVLPEVDLFDKTPTLAWWFLAGGGSLIGYAGFGGVGAVAGFLALPMAVILIYLAVHFFVIAVNVGVTTVWGLMKIAWGLLKVTAILAVIGVCGFAILKIAASMA